MKICGTCHVEKSLEMFSRSKQYADGHTYECKECASIRYKKFREQNRERLNAANRKYYKIYYKKNASKVLKKHKSYYEQNKEKLKPTRKKYYEENKEHYLAQQREYVSQPHVIKRRLKLSRKRDKERRSTDINYRLKKILRSRIWNALNGVCKSSRTKDLTGCSIEQLREHLQRKFVDGMSWDNYGKWHVDHIKPCAAFDLSDPMQQKECFHYTNLQPLWAEDNLKKSDKLL